MRTQKRSEISQPDIYVYSLFSFEVNFEEWSVKKKNLNRTKLKWNNNKIFT